MTGFPSTRAARRSDPVSTVEPAQTAADVDREVC
jgi:hypothetical protein